MALTKVSFSMIQGGALNVLDFGAVADGVTNCTPAVQAAIDYAFENNISSVYFPNGIYFYATPVIVNFDAQNGLRIYGESMAKYMFFDVGGTRFTGAAGLESIFIFTLSNLTQAKGYTFECSHIFFSSGLLGTAGPLTALKNKIGGAPARPFIVKNCGFSGFDKAIVSDISGTGGLTTGIGQVIIRENTFVTCGFALHGTGGLGNILDLIFCDNISENGGSIYVNGMGGTFNVSDNLLEGQPDALELNCGLASGTVSRNYFEANSGFLIKVTASNPNSQLVLGPQYILNSAGGRVLISNIQLEMQEKTLARNGILFDAPFCLGKNIVNNAGILNPVSWSNPNYRFDLNSIPTKTTVPPGAITGGQWVTQGGAAQDTPIGNLDVVAVTGNGTIMTPTLPLNANDAVVAMAIARRVSGNPFLYLTVADNTFGTVYIVNSDTAQSLGDTAIGEWVFVMAIVRVPASSGGNPRIRWVANGGGTVDMSETYFYSVTTPTNNSTPAYYFMPNP